MKRWICVLLLAALLAGLSGMGVRAETVNFDDITVEVERYTYYKKLDTYRQSTVVVRTNNKILEEGRDYTTDFDNDDKVGPNATVTIYGQGDYAGYKKTISYAVLKCDLAEAIIQVNGKENGGYTGFVGYPCTPEIRVSDDRINTLWPYGYDPAYVAVHENNVNPGEATVRAYGIGNYCGMIKGNYNIGLKEEEIYLKLPNSTETCYEERYITPTKTTFSINLSDVHAVSYALYKVEGETAKLIDEWENLDCHASSGGDEYTYDFSEVYQRKDVAGEVYVLAYAYLAYSYPVRTGVLTMAVPAKVPPATTMQVEQVPDAGNFRTQYVTYYSEDGVLELPKWTSSNPAVATVNDGTVTFKRPGKVTITGKCGNLTDSVQLMAKTQDLTGGTVFGYDAKTGETFVYFDGYLLEEGTDYTKSVSALEGITEVTVEGINFFEGQLVQQFDAQEQAVGHSHGFDNACDTACNSCDYTRITRHVYSDLWSKNKTHHWHACAICGDAADRAEHILSVEDADTCTECGLFYIPGDLNCDVALDEDDAIWLLRSLLLPEEFPVTENADFDASGGVNEDDAIYLLRHVLMPEKYPL